MSAQHIREEDLELLALGVIAGEECESFRTHISACAECSRNFAAAQGRVALFALAAPPQSPSSAARDDLLERIRAEKVAAASISAGEMHSENRAVAVPRRTRWWNSVWVPAAAVLAIAMILLWVNNRRLDNQLQGMQNAEQKFEAQEEHEKALVAFFSAQDTEAVTLAPKPLVPKSAWARVKFNSRLGMVCYTGDLPAPPPHMEYQMWIVPMVGNPISAGAFMPASFSNGKMCMAQMPQGVDCKSFAVTIEPMGGMPRPTGPQVLSLAGNAALPFTMGSASSASVKSHAWTGWISDSYCGTKGMSANHKDCAVRCVKEKGASYVFVNSRTKKVYAIQNQGAVIDLDLGTEVTLTGTLNSDGSMKAYSITPKSRM